MISRTLLSLSLVALLASHAGASPVGIQEQNGKYVVTIGGELFTQYIQGEQKPFLYPVIGPNGVGMTRDFPMKNTPGESTDHPWHSGVYYTHGSVNGLDFWNDRTDEEKLSRIELIKVVKAENAGPDKAVIVATHNWTHDGKVIMSDRTEMAFSGDDSKRFIDYKVTLIASAGDVRLGDTKEGCMAIRMNHKFRVKDQGAKVVNSEGVSGADVWGKPARWISYSNKIEGSTLGVSLFDHPDNFRYPSTWHARDYGLCAANAFGLQYFTPEREVMGDWILKAGKTLSFSYRLVFHKGDHKQAKIDKVHAKWSQE